MKRFFLVLLVCVILFIAVLWVSQLQSEKKTAEEMYNKFCTAVSDYPALPAPFVSSFCQFEKDGVKYLIIQNEGKYITGVRLASGDTIYCHNGITYQVSDGKLEKTDSNISDVNSIIASNLSALLLDDTVFYTYHRPTEKELPLWIYPYDPPYLRIRRESYEGYMETMIYSDTDQQEIRWCITKSSSNEDTKLFLHASEHSISASDLYIYGWGDIPEAVLMMLSTG